MPVGSVTGRPAPIAAAIGSSIRNTRRAPALSAAFLDGAALDRGRARGHADDDQRAGEAAAVVHLADEVLDHLLGDFEVGDDAVAQRADGLDVAGRAAQHHLGLVADGQHLLLALFLGDGDHRRLVEDDAAALDIDQRIGGPQVDRHVRGHPPRQLWKT